ncbi:MAG: phenylacetate--CoA ligase family protein [candidate division NC10 bacterium]|nr:phenylacetate--CoA ligase family protein [candidate division NC10 bacterium]
MNPIEELANAPWPELIRRARESGPQFVLRYLKMLRRQWLPQEQIRRYQERRLERILRHALERVPAYREASGTKVSVMRGEGFRVLDQFPLIDRWTLVDQWERFVARNARRFSPKLVQTGGTTGKPVSLYLDGRTRALWNMMSLLRRQWAGWRPGDRSVLFWQPYGDRPATYDVNTPHALDRSERELFLNAARLDDRRLREYVHLVVSFRPQFLRGFPSVLILLARALNSLRARLRLRAVLTGGELLGDEQRHYLEETFVCKVYDWYNMWENVATALQCERGTYHVVPELSHVEILRNGRPCKSGEVGEIVGTHLGNYSMPLIRYNMNDLASPIESACLCGRNTQPITLIGGRGRDIIVTPRGYVVVPTILLWTSILPPHSVEKLQFYQERKDEVLVRIVRGNGYAEDDTRRLIAEIDQIFDGAVTLRWEYVEEIPRTPSGKYPYVVSHVPLEL